MASESATLGGGCFWCLEAVLELLPGVVEVVPGYAGGALESPTYEQVCSGATGHAEVVRVTFDATRLSYADLLDVFFRAHDPTSLNRQGADVGTQYRSVILYESPEQERVARQAIERMGRAAGSDVAIVTDVAPLIAFYPAEEYHRHYFRRHPERAYCRTVIAPKVARFAEHYREGPVCSH